VSLLYCVSSVFCFHICFILLLHGPVFLTKFIVSEYFIDEVDLDVVLLHMCVVVSRIPYMFMKDVIFM
jgi:hypothetical protein